MKKTRSCQLIILIIICLASKTTLAQLTNSQAKQWTEKGEWRHGFKLNLYPGINYVEFYKQYHRNKALWDKAFAYISNTNFNTLKVGVYPVVGKKVYSKITEGVNKDYDKTAWEAHHDYIDLQLMVRGKEKIAVAHLASAKPITKYDPVEDVTHYTAPTANTYIADTKTLFVFFPENTHRPSIRFDGNDQFKKVVVKVSVAK